MRVEIVVVVSVRASVREIVGGPVSQASGTVSVRIVQWDCET
jgi:hypothetical protein